MKIDKQRDQVIEQISEMLRTTPFTFEFVVRKKPKGIKVIYELTQEQMEAMVENAANKEQKNNKE